MRMAHIIHQLMALNTRFQGGFMKAKNHPTLKNLWPDLVAVTQWVELDGQELKRIDGTRPQFNSPDNRNSADPSHTGETYVRPE